MLCPELIGRVEELARLRARLGALGDHHGGVVTVVGDGGVGKTRLVAAATDTTEAVVLTGRSVPADNPEPYRAITEALLGALRGRALPVDPSLAGFEPHLGRLVPGWGVGAVTDDSPLLVGEAVARFLAVIAGTGTCVVVLEDLHWADPETVAVVEHLGEALRDLPVLCIGTARPDGAVSDLLDRTARRDADAIVRLAPLGVAEVDRMVAACMASPEPVAGLGDFVAAHSDGNPFLVEELLAGLTAAGAVRAVDGRWETTGPLTPAVPASLQASIGRRVNALDRTTRRVLEAASLLGRQFEWELLPGIAEVDGRATIDALRAAVDAQLIEVDGAGFRFRHALTREAVLADVLPPERRDLAARAWPAIERAHPGLPGPILQLAADLAEAAGDRPAAATRLVESARRALAGGALATASATARRAGHLASEDPATALDADEVLVRVLAASGEASAALAAGRDLATRMADVGAAPERRADLLVDLVRAALVAGDLESAAATADEAREVAGPNPDLARRARIDVATAAVALDRGDLADAERRSRLAVDEALAAGQDEVRIEALLLLGRSVRPNAGSAEAMRWFAEAADVAETAGLSSWHLRAQQELAMEGFERQGTGPLQATRDLAARYGAHLTVAAMDLMLADAALADFDPVAGHRAAAACIDASRRYGLAAGPVAQLWLAGAHALAGDDAAMQVAVDASLAPDADDPRILGDLYGRVLTTRAFVRDELDLLPGLLDEMVVHVRRAPVHTSIYPGRILWALLHVTDDVRVVDADAARAAYREATNPFAMDLFDRYGTVLDAIALGRAGDRAGADALIGPVHGAILASPAGRGMARAATLIVARAATRDGWGDPVGWLRESEAWFAAHGFDALVRRSRALLGEAGAPVPRRGRGESPVPTSLRSLGVTSREVDVLKLVVAGRTTKQIAAELHLSPKTVERHLSNLFDRTGVRNRHDLAEIGSTHLADPRS